MMIMLYQPEEGWKPIYPWPPQRGVVNVHCHVDNLGYTVNSYTPAGEKSHWGQSVGFGNDVTPGGSSIVCAVSLGDTILVKSDHLVTRHTVTNFMAVYHGTSGPHPRTRPPR